MSALETLTYWECRYLFVDVLCELVSSPILNTRESPIFCTRNPLSWPAECGGLAQDRQHLKIIDNEIIGWVKIIGWADSIRWQDPIIITDDEAQEPVFITMQSRPGGRRTKEWFLGKPAKIKLFLGLSNMRMWISEYSMGLFQIYIHSVYSNYLHYQIRNENSQQKI